MVGITSTIDFPTTVGALQPTAIAINLDTVMESTLSVFNSSATVLRYSTYLSGSGMTPPDYRIHPSDNANGIALDASNNVYLAGGAVSPDMPTTAGAFQTQGQLQDIADEVFVPAVFVTRFNGNEMRVLPATTTTVTASVNPQIASSAVTFTATVQSTSARLKTRTIRRT